MPCITEYLANKEMHALYSSMAQFYYSLDQSLASLHSATKGRSATFSVQLQVCNHICILKFDELHSEFPNSR